MKLAVVDMSQTRDHFALNPWRAGERRLTFHLTLDAAPEVGRAAVQLHQALAPLTAMRPVPVPWLHLTMTGFGSVGEVPDAAVAELRHRVFEQWQRFASEVVVYAQVLVAHESVMLTARTDAWLQELATVQRDAVDAVLGGRTWGTLWPHTSVAYATGPVDADTLRRTLERPASELPETLTARPTLTLMELGRDTGTYQWRVLESAAPRD